MKRFTRLGLKAWFFIGLAPLIGIAIGLTIKIRRDRQAELGKDQSAASLRILATKGIFPPNLLSRFEKERGLRIVLDESSTPEDLWEKFDLSKPSPAVPSYDLVALFSYQLPLAVQLMRVQPIDPAKLPSIVRVGPDFREIPSERGFHNVVPILWGLDGIIYDKTKTPAPSTWSDVLKNAKFRGKILFPASTMDLARLVHSPHSEKDLRRSLTPLLSMISVAQDEASFMASLDTPGERKPLFAIVSNGQSAFPPANQPDWQFVIPEDRALFWMICMALHSDSKNIVEAYSFLEFLLESDTALELVESTHQASTNRLLEEKNLDARLKPSFLRQIPLSRVDLWKDFSRAKEIREIISGPAKSLSEK